ncbi:MAG: MFS transporter [Chloroflexi bacterium]|nr:MFS transporter [Chloroflexota bacterium]
MPISETGPTTEHSPPAGAPKLYYGWVVVAVMAVTGAATMALGTLNFGLFIKPMGDSLGIGRAMFGWAQTARQVTSAGTAPIVGGLIDRFGARILLPFAALVTGGALIGLGHINHSWQLVLLFAVMGLVGMSGPGALVTSVPVLKWFVRNRGRAVAFMSLGVPVGALTFIPLTQVFIDSFGWRQAWIILAIIGMVIIVPLSLALVRRQPEDMGLLPDGAPTAIEPHAHGTRRPRRTVDETSWTAREAVHSPVFWRLVAIFAVVMLGMGTVGVHRIPAFMDRGLDTTLISFATALDAVSAGVSTFTMAFLVTRFPARLLGAAGFTLLAIASVLTIYADTVPIMFVSMAIFGMGIGGMMFLQNFLWADYFGRASLGAIRGIVTPVTLLVGGAGAPLAGYVRDITGSYNPIWWAGVGLMILAALVMTTTTAPGKPKPGHAIPSPSLS